MSVPYVAMAAAVDIVQRGPQLEAVDRRSRKVLGTAQRCTEAGEQLGWLVTCGPFREMVATVTTARFALLKAASNLDGVL